MHEVTGEAHDDKAKEDQEAIGNQDGEAGMKDGRGARRRLRAGGRRRLIGLFGFHGVAYESEEESERTQRGVLGEKDSEVLREEDPGRREIRFEKGQLMTDL